MGIGDEGIMAVGPDVSDVVMDMLSKLTDEDSELISIYNGEGFSDEDAEALRERISETYPDIDIEVNHGGQPVYYVILSVE